MDDTWKKSYPTKPDWWDEETEPRCDECGLHMEDSSEWCGDCGGCREHCSPTALHAEQSWL